MSTKAFFSNRIYKQTLTVAFQDAIQDTLVHFNRAKQFAFNSLIKEKRTGQMKREKSLHLLVKDKFQLNDYYVNSAVQAANSQVKSLEELKKLYIQNKTEQILATKRKLKKERHRLTTLRKLKLSFIKGKPTFPKKSREQKQGNYFVVSYKKKTDLYYHAYQFEHTYLDPTIDQLKSRIGFLLSKLHRLEEELKSLHTRVSSAVFGSKKRFKAQYTKECYRNNPDAWLEEWRASRYQKMVLSGRKDAASGNFVFHYHAENYQLHFKTPSGVLVHIHQVSFPYGQEAINTAIQSQLTCKDKKKHGKPIAWAIEDHGEYYIMKCMVEIPPPPNTNYSKSDGVIGVDCNVDYFAIANINQKGQLLSSHTHRFHLTNKTSGQLTKIIEAEAIAVVQKALEVNKPISLEKLNTTTSKVSNPYGNKKANRKLSMFAYRKMIDSIKARAEKVGIAVLEVNPAYTSQIGKMKYMKRFGISIHESASYVIARRAMGFSEKLPPVLGALLPEKMIGAHHWAQWGYVSKRLKEVRTHAFYLSELFDVDKFHETGELFVSGALTELEQKSLSALKSRKAVS